MQNIKKSGFWENKEERFILLVNDIPETIFMNKKYLKPKVLLWTSVLSTYIYTAVAVTLTEKTGLS